MNPAVSARLKPRPLKVLRRLQEAAGTFRTYLCTTGEFYIRRIFLLLVALRLVIRGVTAGVRTADLVRTQHLPPPAEMARDRGILSSRGPSRVVSSSVIVGQETPLYHDGYGHIADGFRAGGAVHRTACFRGCDGHSGR